MERLGNVTGEKRVAGIGAYKVTIKDCYNVGKIQGDKWVGGIGHGSSITTLIMSLLPMSREYLSIFAVCAEASRIPLQMCLNTTGIIHMFVLRTSMH